MKAFLLFCILLATISLSPSSAAARELADFEKGIATAAVNASGKPITRPVFGCGRGNRYCLPARPSPPKKPCNTYERCPPAVRPSPPKNPPKKPCNTYERCRPAVRPSPPKKPCNRYERDPRCPNP
ncbi:hypothetical protein JCGZ_25667 [Jatropha curcas]|uniref:Uncharacterized protein n=1 Tax=Jatropha curcas TaxID=180498 RepID=A0A067JK59_JATCU|nr:hypothetical protein JCGZ_25667 [Jatropha curcas]